MNIPIDPSIIVAIISLLGTFLGSFSGYKLIHYRVKQLETKVEKHNSVVERVYKLEQKVEDLSNEN